MLYSVSFCLKINFCSLGLCSQTCLSKCKIYKCYRFPLKNNYKIKNSYQRTITLLLFFFLFSLVSRIKYIPKKSSSSIFKVIYRACLQNLDLDRTPVCVSSVYKYANSHNFHFLDFRQNISIIYLFTLYYGFRPKQPSSKSTTTEQLRSRWNTKVRRD